MLVEGVRAGREALDSGVSVVFAVISPKLAVHDAEGSMRARLSGHDVTDVADAELRALSDTANPQGSLLVCSEPAARLGSLTSGRHLILDAVQDPGNAGTLIRCAVAFGFDGVICLDGTVDPWGAKAVRASAGTVFRCPPTLATASDVRGRVEEVGVRFFIAEASGTDAEAYRGVEHFVLAVGNEGGGVRPELRVAGHVPVAVPMSGGVDSINVGVAGAILMYTLSKGDARA